MAFKEGKTLKGWGVVRNAPWHFAGLYPTWQEADAKAREMGAGYAALFGEQQEGTDNFILSSLDKPAG
jgi:hypothetical protein